MTRDPASADRQGARASRAATLLTASLAFAPIAIISLLGRHSALLLGSKLNMDLTNLAVMHRVLGSLGRPSLAADSWGPMLKALGVLSGSDRNALYETLFFNAHVRFQYPPTSLLLIDLLARFGLARVSVLNAINSGVLLLEALAVAVLAWSLFQPSADRPSASVRLQPAGMALVAGGAAFLFYPIIRAQALGQIQLWLDLAFTLAVILWSQRRRLLPGVLVGLACAVKPQFGLLLLWGLVSGERMFALGIVAGLAPLGLASLALYGLHDNLAYLGVLSFLSRHGENFFANNSVNGILNWYFTADNSLRWNEQGFAPYNPIVYAGTLAATLVFVGLLALSAMRTRRERRKASLSDLGVATICTIAGSPVAWEHHYGLLLPLFLVALCDSLAVADSGLRATLLTVTFVAWVLVADFIPFAALLVGTPFVILQAYCFFGAVILLGVLIASREAERAASATPVPARS